MSESSSSLPTSGPGLGRRLADYPQYETLMASLAAASEARERYQELMAPDAHELERIAMEWDEPSSPAAVRAAASQARQVLDRLERDLEIDPIARAHANLGPLARSLAAADRAVDEVKTGAEFEPDPVGIDAVVESMKESWTTQG